MWGDTITFSAEIKEEMVVKPTMSARGPLRGTVLNSDISRSGGRGGGFVYRSVAEMCLKQEENIQY